MPSRRFDAHCHIFDLEYLVLEAGNMLWDEIRGRYPTAPTPPSAEGAKAGPRTIIEFLRWLKELGHALDGDESANLRTVQKAASEAWKDGAPVWAIPLMMDIYYLFAPPIRIGGTAPYVTAAAPRGGLDGAAARSALELKLSDADLPDEWTKRILEKVDRPEATLSLGGLFDTWGFRHHREKLEALVRAGGALLPFFAVDPRRPGAVAAVTRQGLVGRNGPFYGVKLYPRLGYDPRVPELDPLYDWCADAGIPITTHCGPSGFPPWDNGYGSFGHPANFQEVLKKRPRLRIDFAHFGSMDEEWANAVIGLMRDFPGQAYSDLSCYTGTDDPRKFLEQHRKDWEDPRIRKHTMFGTDFDVMFLTKVGMPLGAYYDQFKKAFTPEDLASMTMTAAESFLLGDAARLAPVKGAGEMREPASSLNGGPNSWSPVVVKNSWGGEVTNVTMSHRYDDDHFDSHEWPSIQNDGTGNGMQAGYWTGAFRTGKDYWHITFQADGNTWSCKENFYCFLTSDDVNKLVTIEISKETMKVRPPVSSNCEVSLQQVG